MKKHFALIIAVMLLMLCILPNTIGHYRLENGTTVTAECEVVDKSSHFNTQTGERFYLDLLFTDGPEPFETRIELTGLSYEEDVTVGDRILCRVTYDEKGIIEAIVQDGSVDQYVTEEKVHDLFTIVPVVVVLLVLVFKIIVLSEKTKTVAKNNKK